MDKELAAVRSKDHALRGVADVVDGGDKFARVAIENVNGVDPFE